MIIDLKNIAPFIQKQFPAFYLEDGDNFIQFVRAYYEWLDEYGPIGQSRNLPETLDIDDTADKFLSHFFEKYLHGIPKSILGNKRLLEKHILDLYRSKGSIEGLKLLFRFLYNKEIEVYIPETNMLRLSDGKWKKKKYLEVSNMPYNYTFNNRFITGSTSGAIGYVEQTLKFYLGNQVSHVFYVTNIQGGPTGQEFLEGEFVKHDDIDLRNCPYIQGSPIGAIVNDSSADFAVGDELVTDSTSGERLKFKVASIADPNKLKGYIKFKILDGGFGYALDSPVSITYGTATTGTGANFKIGAISNTSNFTYNTNLLGPMLNVGLNAVNYGPTLNFTFIGSIINSALVNATIQVGTITKLAAVTSGDHNYNGSVIPSVIDYRIYGYGIPDGKGGYWGGDANISGLLSTGNGIIETVLLTSSGLGYNDNAEIIQVYNSSNNELQAELAILLGGIGVEEGYWENTDGFLNTDMYIQDSDYYQEYSYEIQIEKSFSKYKDILKKVMHPVGNKPFGKVLIEDSYKNVQPLELEEDVVIQKQIITGDGQSNTFSMFSIVFTPITYDVYIDNTLVANTNYTYSFGTISFNTAPPSGSIIEFRYNIT